MEIGLLSVLLGTNSYSFENAPDLFIPFALLTCQRAEALKLSQTTSPYVYLLY